jgi:energy-coupling factor transporter transmembrane protein EcfT
MKPSFLLGFFIEFVISKSMHPSLRIISLFLFAIMVYCLTGAALHWLFVIAILLLLGLDLIMLKMAKISAWPEPNFKLAHISEWLKLITRMRYILLFLMIVYALNTPGEYVAAWNFMMTPTYEGVTAGIEQTLRLVLILAGLALLLVNTGRAQFIAGLYYLMQPFRYLGLDPERFAVRLWLTIYYVEQGQQRGRQTLLHQLKNLDDLVEVDSLAPEQITLVKPSIKWHDVLILVLVLSGTFLICV